MAGEKNIGALATVPPDLFFSHHSMTLRDSRRADSAEPLQLEGPFNKLIRVTGHAHGVSDSDL